MENNAALFVDSLLARFGTTMDRLMPVIIDFGRYECKHTIRVCIYMIALGLISMVVSHLILKSHRVGYNAEIIWELIFGLGLVAVIICVLLIIVDLATLQKWYDFPEVMAYKYIFGLMR